ncbi:agamous-like MADS-box protein AGL75 [Abrus precatorius]|uniref:Agamous-like MADS-box protein AGL75 n=1 Tax=Abrus precatorius TaxID=3816 RepID=A0A8B8K3P7_ABRPR|nr:agamous-like MADS-box protein AGL75 [Abrus precatorius]
MGRPKLTLKFISNGREREVRFMNRKKRLLNNMSEFCTKCGVNGCLIIYGGDGDAQPVTWPEDPIAVHSIIEKYERTKNEKFPKNFDLKDFFKNRKNTIKIEISKVQKEIFNIKYPTWHASFDGLDEEKLWNFIALLDDKLEACNQRIIMLRHNHQIEANFNFLQNMVQFTSAATSSSQLNCMQTISLNQHIFAPMNPLNDINLLASYQLNLDRGSSSQSQMLNFDPSFMQLMAKNNGVVDDNCANQIGALENFTNQSNVVVDLSTSHLGDPLDCSNQLGEIEDWTNNYGKVFDWPTQFGETINWTNQHCVSMIGSTSYMNDASNFGTTIHELENEGHEDNLESSLCNYCGNCGLENSTNQPNVPVDLMSQLGGSMDCFTQFSGFGKST